MLGSTLFGGWHSTYSSEGAVMEVSCKDAEFCAIVSPW